MTESQVLPSLPSLIDRSVLIQQQEIILEIAVSTNQLTAEATNSAQPSLNQGYENSHNLSPETLQTLLQNTPQSSDYEQRSVHHLLKHLFHKLLSAIHSGSLVDAQTAYDNLQSELQQLGIIPSASASSSTVPSSQPNGGDASSTENPGLQSFLDLINQIGTTLSSQNIAQAQSVVAKYNHVEDDHGTDRPNLKDLLQAVFRYLEAQSVAVNPTSPIGSNTSYQEFAVLLYEHNSNLSVTNTGISLNTSTTEIALIG